MVDLEQLLKDPNAVFYALDGAYRGFCDSMEEYRIGKKQNIQPKTLGDFLKGGLDNYLDKLPLMQRWLIGTALSMNPSDLTKLLYSLKPLDLTKFLYEGATKFLEKEENKDSSIMDLLKKYLNRRIGVELAVSPETDRGGKKEG